MMFMFVSFPGGSEWFVILVVALLLFGRRLPEVARSMGQSITEFKKGLQGIDVDIPKDKLDITKTLHGYGDAQPGDPSKSAGGSDPGKSAGVDRGEKK